MRKIFGIGWAKTGTTTLGKCFEILGFNHQSQNLVLVKNIQHGDFSTIFSMANKKDSFEDWPWALLYKEFDMKFKNSRFVLTIRETDRWLSSYQNMLKNQGNATEELNEIRRIIYGLPFPGVSEKRLAERYEKHNEDVMRYFSDRPNDLLVVDWEKKHGWRSLCDFLELAEPATPFPHVNKGNYGDNL